ncbi:MAG: hypothetical protein HY472_00480 [Candidatus Sungbacteria bacterium]|nr:hypothetical protein [Candidatus Sungbacteria bacterium]
MDSIQKSGTPHDRGSQHTIDLRGKDAGRREPPDEKEKRIRAWFGAKAGARPNQPAGSGPESVESESFGRGALLPDAASGEYHGGKEKKLPSGAEPRFSGTPAAPGAHRWRAPGRPRFFFVAGGVALAGILFLFFLSGAFARLTVIVDPKERAIPFENITLSLAVSSPAPDYEKRVLPAQVFEFSREKTQEFSATGKANVRTLAAGKVRIYNAFSAAPQALVARTRFLTEKGVLYRLPAGIVVPGAEVKDGKIIPQFVEAELRADAPGEESNLSGEIRLRIPGFQGSPKYDGFYASAPSGFQGGVLGEKPVATKEDIAAAEKQVSQAAYDEVRAEMAQKIPASFTSLPSLQEIEILELRSPKVGAPGERFSVSAAAEGRAILFQKDHAIEAVARMIGKDHPDEELLASSAELEYQAADADFEKSRATVAVRGAMRGRRTFSSHELSLLLAGKKEGSVIEAMKLRDEFTKFRLAFFPPWRFRAPSDPAKIRFEIE